MGILLKVPKGIGGVSEAMSGFPDDFDKTTQNVVA